MWWWIYPLFMWGLICFILGLIIACLAIFADKAGEAEFSTSLYVSALVLTIPLMGAIGSVLVWFVVQVFMRICNLYL